MRYAAVLAALLSCAAFAVQEQAPARRDLNKATVAALDSVKRLTPATARAIVARRDSLGAFTSWVQVDSTKGVGPVVLANLQATFAIVPKGVK